MTARVYPIEPPWRPYRFVSCLAELRHGDGRVGHPVREAPLVVVPGENPDKASFDDLRLGQIEDRAGRIVVEVDRNEWLVVGVEHTLQRAGSCLLDCTIDLRDIRVARGIELEIDERDIRRGDADGSSVQLAV